MSERSSDVGTLPSPRAVASGQAESADQPASVLHLGKVELIRIVETEGPLLKPAEIFPDSTPEAIQSHLDWLVPHFYDPITDRLVISIQSFLLRSHDKWILIDTCVGDCKSRARPDFDQQQWGWLDRLHATGVTPEDIDIVVSTHLHVDHVGWHTQQINGQWVPTFPNARYLFTHEEWAYWKEHEGHPGLVRTGDYIGDSVLPVFEAGLAELVPMDYVIDEAIRLRPAPGHTPGHVAVEIQSGSQRALLTGDAFHHPLQCCYPQWSTRFCADPEHARQTRLSLLAACAHDETLVLPAHFPAPTAGYVRQVSQGDDSTYRFEFASL